VPTPAAVLWDLDGTLVDTEPYWIAAEQDLARAHGVTWTHDDALTLVGLALLDSGHVLRTAGVDLPEREIVDVLVARVVERIDEEIPWRPGARTLLAELAAVGVPSAVVTMSYRSIADRVAAGLPAGTFGALVTGDTVRHGKPHPEPYLVAAQRLGVDVTRCVAIEDSRTGLASAEAAGARSVAVPLLVDLPPAPGRSRVASLVDLTVDDLGRIAAGAVIDRLAEPVA